MTSSRRSSTVAILFLGVSLGGVAGYLVAQSREPKLPSVPPDLTAELAEIHAELAEVKAQITPASVDDQLKQLQTVVTDILLRGDEFALRADFARTADRLEGHSASDFALADADGDGAADLGQLQQTLNNILSGATPVGKAKKADSAGNTEFLGNLPLTDFALADHAHTNLPGNVMLLDNVRIGGTLTVGGNAIASGDVQVFGEVVAVGGIMPGTVDIEPKPAIAGMIRYNRSMGILEYCDGARWNVVAVVEQP